MKIIKYYTLSIIITCFTILHIIVNVYIYWKFSSFYSLKRQLSCIAIVSNIEQPVIILIEPSKSSDIPITCIDILTDDTTENIEFHQPLLVTVVDEHNKPVVNISVHLKPYDYSPITIVQYTNHSGNVIFHNLPRNIQGFVEVTCSTSKRYAFMEVDSHLGHNITLVLKEILSMNDDEEYDSMDRGYYAL